MFELSLSPYILAIGVAWCCAHIAKYLISSIKRGRLKGDLLRQFFISGGMPSSHAATSVAVWAVILLKDGMASGLFGLATLLTLIVCYDAVKVRRSSGEQGLAIQALIKEQKSKVSLPRSARGHTPLEVVVGAVLGFVVGVVVFLTTT